MEIVNISAKEMSCIEKEVEIHSRVKTPHCIQLYQSIKTTNHLYMILDFCNGSDLGQLLKLRKTVS